LNRFMLVAAPVRSVLKDLPVFQGERWPGFDITYWLTVGYTQAAPFRVSRLSPS
jgi:hypothetical protein